VIRNDGRTATPVALSHGGVGGFPLPALNSRAATNRRDWKEQFWAVLLDGKNRVLREERVSEGSLTASLVHPREVFAPAIRESAGALVLVHNHPSGDPTPSVEDVEITRRLCAVADLVGIRVLDHVVVGDGAFVSFLERGLLGGGK